MYTYSDAQTDSYAPRIDLRWREPSGPEWKPTRDELDVHNGLKMFLFYLFQHHKAHTHTHTMLHHARAFSVCARQQPVRACPSTSLSHDVNTRVQAFMNDCLSTVSVLICASISMSVAYRKVTNPHVTPHPLMPH